METRICFDCGTHCESTVCPGCGRMTGRWQKVDEDRDPFIGRMIDERYRILDLIGRGGMGSVYVAEQVAVRRAVALKVINSQDSFNSPLNDRLEKRFRREAMAASQLEHHNTVRVFDFGRTRDDVLYLVMELLHGNTLFGILKNGPIPPARMVRIAIQVCRSLAEAHDKGIIHRDLKPDNIMVYDTKDERDFVKVLDFGMAKMTQVSDTSLLTSHGVVVGTATYMAPEQARGAYVVPGSDLYSLGVVMYEALSGRVPFDATTQLSIMLKHMTDPVPPLVRDGYPPGISSELNGIVERLLEKMPGKRPSSAMQLADCLARIPIDGFYDDHVLRPAGAPGSFLTPTMVQSLKQMLTSAEHRAFTRATRVFRRRKKSIRKRVWPVVIGVAGGLAAILAGALALLHFFGHL